MSDYKKHTHGNSHFDTNYYENRLPTSEAPHPSLIKHTHVNQTLTANVCVKASPIVERHYNGAVSDLREQPERVSPYEN
jgi:hypothetical protein